MGGSMSWELDCHKGHNSEMINGFIVTIKTPEYFITVARGPWQLKCHLGDLKT